MRNVKSGHLVPVMCIDAGHCGKYNQSPEVPEYYESDMNWKLHLLLNAELEKRGIRVILTRPDQNTDLDLVKRGMLAQDADAFLSEHSNAAATKDPNWVMAYHQVDDNCGEMDEQSRELAELMAAAAAKVMGVDYECRAVKSSADRDGNGYKDDYYGVLRGAHAVHTAGVILEHGFHTNEAQARWLLDEANLQKLAEAEAEAICQYFDWHQEEAYTQDDFIREVQAACGTTVNGSPWPETIFKTVTVSATINHKHPVVKAIQKKLAAMGYEEVGEADGIAGPKFTSALAHFQQDHECTPTGIAEEWGKTWQKLLGMA